ncbi:nucleic-acid-binding protein from transposon X-element [Trichonephila clavipes]|nr:nucleic-acid-binding protein from transposon X-element [Trichonephila clavipes]
MDSIPELSSDHNPVFLNFSLTSPIHQDNARAVTTCCSSGPACGDDQKANLLAITLKDNFTENERPNGDYPIDNTITTTLKIFFSHPPPLPITPTDPDEVLNYIKTLSNNKAPALNLVRAGRKMEQLVEDQSVIMEDNESFPPLLTDDERCLNIHALDKEINAFNTRKGYVTGMIDVEKNSYNTSEEIVKKLEAEQLSLEDTLQTLEGKLTKLLPCPKPMCMHNTKSKAVKRSAAPIIRPAKFTAKANKNIKSNEVTKDFVFPKKTAKNNLTQEKNEQLIVNNSFAALNTANNDAEDVTQPQPKIKPIFMKITPDYNLLLQEIHRTHPTAKNTHMKGYFKIEAETEDHHREITAYLTGKSVGYYVLNPPENRPLKLVIKGLPEDVEPEDVKKDLISKGINVEKVAQLKKFATKARLPLFLIEITRDDNVNDIYQIRSVLYMQIKLDPFRKSNRVTQCYNCNNFHHASQNCFMKTRCLKCGENHRTGECSIKEKIENPLCINCNANGHMASSTECPLFPKPRKGAGKTAAENRKRNETNKISQVIPGLSFAQVLNPNKSQQMATRGNASSASNQNIETNQTNNNDKNKNSKK